MCAFVGWNQQPKRLSETSCSKDSAQSSVKYTMAAKILRKCKTILDIGCGNGSFCVLLKNSLADLQLCGIDVSEEAIRIAKSRGICAYQLNVDTDSFPFENEYFDGIFCGELIEHLYDPDHLLDEIYRVLKNEGICVLTTPNLASWYNRIFLLLGYQPLFTEVSRRHEVGYPFPFFSKEGRGGHIRVFTFKALRELVIIHKFKIVFATGFGINTRVGYGKRWKILAEIANKIFNIASLSSDIMLVLSK